MKRHLSAVLVFLIVFSLLPLSAGASVITAEPSDAIVTQIAASYGYTDEGMTLSWLATEIGCSNREAAALAMMADRWVTGNNPAARGTIGNLAGLAHAYQSYMEAEGTWDSFRDQVNSSIEISGDLFLNAGGLWDFLGFDAFADEVQFPDSYFNGRWYTSGLNRVIDSTVRPSAPASGSPVYAGWYGYQVENYIGLMNDPGYRIKMAAVGSVTDVPFVSITSQIQPALWLCANCGASGSTTMSNPLMKWITGAHQNPSVYRDLGGISHQCTVPLPSEQQARVRADVSNADTLPEYLSIAAEVLADPTRTVAAVVDAYGIPGVIPPGVISGGMSDAQDAGQALRDKAVEVASQAASSTVPGFDMLGKALAAIMNFFADSATFFQSILRSVFTPNRGYIPDWFARLREWVDSWSDGVPLISSVRSGIASVPDSIDASGGGLGSVDLPGVGSFSLDGALDAMAVHRGKAELFLWFTAAFVGLRWLQRWRQSIF